MYTTRGRRLLGQALRNEVLSKDLVRKDGFEYKKPHTTFIDAVYSSGTLKGFFGRLDTDPQTGGLLRVGVIWGANVTSKSALTTTVQEVAPIYDIDESSTAANIETFRGQVRTAEDETRSVRAELSAAQDRERLLNDKRAQLEEAMRDLNQEKERYSQLANTAENARQDAENRLNKEHQIIVGTIVYGGKNYSFDENIHNKVRRHILNRWTISLTNEFFEEDPDPGSNKLGVIQVWSSEGGQQSLQGYEGSSETFY